MRYLYHETSEKEAREINNALLTDNELRELYLSMQAVKAGLDTARLEPSAGTVSNILRHSRSEQHHGHEH